MPWEQLLKPTLFDVLIRHLGISKTTVVLQNRRKEINRINPQLFTPGGLVENADLCVDTILVVLIWS